MKRLIVVSILLVLLLAACSQPTPEIIRETVLVTQPPLATGTPYPTYTPQEPLPTHTAYPTYTSVPPAPTYTPYPTLAVEPTSTPVPEVPTDTPIPPAPTDTPAAAAGPETIVLTGSGSMVVDVAKDSMGAVVHITGNAAGRHFAVTSYGAGGEKYDLLVNTTDPYDGFRSIDFLDDEHTKRFEVTAEGEWRIEIIPLEPALLQERIINSPGSYEGSGDDIFFVLGDCDLATVKGNDEGRYFGVTGWYGRGRDLLVNTTDPYEGTVMMKRDTFAVEVRAVGAWLISITAP